MPPEEKDVDACIRVLEALLEDHAELTRLDRATRQRLLTAAGKIARPDREAKRKLARAFRKQDRHKQRAEDESKLDRTGIRQKRAEPIFLTPPPGELAADAGGGVFTPAAGDMSNASTSDEQELRRERQCYVCKAPFSRLHFFYDQMCTPCGDFNHAKRTQRADLRGRVALVTGGRVKIGYQTVMLLLRAGARVVVSTRFPKDAAHRFTRELDFEEWKDRLAIYGLDLRHTPSVEAFARHLLETEPRLDFIIHNACQTVRRPTGFYAHLMKGEEAALVELPAPARPLLEGYEALRATNKRLGSGSPKPASPVGLAAAAALSQVPLVAEDYQGGSPLFPEGSLDQDLQQVDLRAINSWRLALHEVSTVELLEVQLVNAIAPFVLTARLKPLMLRERTFDKHVVNVSAMEGQFYRRYKTDKHPHTNMAKAALNMMTRTSAPDFARDGIFMNSVDTGWVTDEDPAHIATRKREEHGFHPPLDIVDGAARVVDPIFDGFNTGRHVWGQFLKDYKPTPW